MIDENNVWDTAEAAFWENSSWDFPGGPIGPDDVIVNICRAEFFRRFGQRVEVFVVRLTGHQVIYRS